MVSTVRSRPNHYELLGLAPTASGGEIAQAFFKELGLIRPRPFGSLAEVTVAYETLRDPIKRRVYDASLRPEPTGKPGSLIERLERGPLVSAASSTAPSASELLRQPEEITQKPKPDTKVDDIRIRPAGPDRPHDVASPVDWKLPGLAAGALILAVGLGAWTGWKSGNDNEPPLPKTAVKLEVSKAPQVSATVAPPVPAPVIAQPVRPARAERSHRSRVVRTPLSPQIELPETAAAESASPPESSAQITNTANASSVSRPVVAAQAKMPLPNSVIARTIGRIGYPCGRVTSTSALEASGAFKVTCASGHSYRAAPVRGRYHFRRY